MHGMTLVKSTENISGASNAHCHDAGVGARQVLCTRGDYWSGTLAEFHTCPCVAGAVGEELLVDRQCHSLHRCLDERMEFLLCTRTSHALQMRPDCP